MIAALLLAAATTCPPPRPISCDRAKQIVAERCPPQATPVCPTQTCPACPEPEVKVLHDTKYIEAYNQLPAPEPKGHFLVGGGPVYHNGLGVTAQGGYQFANGLVLLGGPLYIPQDAGDPVNGEVQSCNDKGKHCRVVPFTAASPAKSALGAQILLLYSFK